jgi:tetratricopeptide (TPR) repeat protein
VPAPLLFLLAFALGPLASSRAQSPAPAGDGATNPWQRHGRSLLDSEDPLGAWAAFRRAIAIAPADPDGRIGLGRTHLMLGESAFGLAYAEAVLQATPQHQEAMTLCVRSLIRAREFDAAVARARLFVQRSPTPASELLAALASSLFRVQQIDEAAACYRQVIRLDPAHPEAHLRLGSGLLPPGPVAIAPALTAAVADLGRGERERAIATLQALATVQPGHPIVHRLLGEALFAQRTAASMAANDPVFLALQAALPVPDARRLPVAEFVPGYARLSPARARVVDRTAALFGKQLGKLVAVGARHDLLQELERTTDAEPRANLRGRRTFDGRVWDDVRGVGGVQAATGIEALDEAAAFGFDTLAHEVAHQVHFLTFTPLQRARIRSLYQAALQHGRCLDYYAASNEAEYFGQGVEAFVSFGKRPGSETTHGHTRFELYEVDRELHDFIAAVVDVDPLDQLLVRERVLTAAVAVALRCGRPRDAVVAAGMLPEGSRRRELLAAARSALRASTCH